MDLYKEIAKVAYELYEKSGKAEGRDDDNWFEAERIVMAQHRVEEKLEAKSSSPPKKEKGIDNKKEVAAKLEQKGRRTEE